MVPSTDHAPNKVIDVLQPGYSLADFVLQPARVIVSAAATETESAVGDDEIADQ